jgi:hypothetical protein
MAVAIMTKPVRLVQILCSRPLTHSQRQRSGQQAVEVLQETQLVMVMTATQMTQEMTVD